MTPVSTPDALVRYAEQTAKSKAYLGYLFWYSCSATTVSQETVRAELEAVGLGDLAPPPPADSDVFRRVFENGARRSHETAMDGVTENLLVRDVVRRGERLVKHIVSELVDSEGEKLSFAECAVVTFTKAAPEQVFVEHTDYNPRAVAFALDLVNDFHNTRGCVGAQAIREIIRRTLDRCLSTSVRENGGVFFVSEEHLEQLQALETFVERVSGAFVHFLPLVDNAKQRDMLKAAFEAEVTEDVIALQSEITRTLRQNGDIGSRKFHGLHKQYMHVQRKIDEYQKLLSEHTEVAGDRLEVLSRSMGALLNKVA